MFTVVCRHPEDSDASESLFLDTARGPRGGYYDAPRGGQQAAQLNGHMSLPVSSHVWVSTPSMLLYSKVLYRNSKHFSVFTGVLSTRPATFLAVSWTCGFCCLQAAARMVAESRAACKEVWAPGYDHSPGLSDSEDPPDRVSRMPTGCPAAHLLPKFVRSVIH